ncbi:methylated-DNA--[protein]-cysteine S-methyltransferase [Listeria sp. FSL L7-0091]|uniref:methylated-DNA--[protein]-cysteine S-methyltransferase n=1 Tax=Listeria farberi TaxID=2713500 RepID=A0A7X1DE46_9LIST|nr:methylated-DNA--[protein]-cysteine S-methyltransferase [Listeria farberi]MBC1375144.1 methylated-DNA--[protein]-cysteine S-methyltransferase [Listeria farberi]MBC1381867.1 methylated-DNA--[protein]-cysteine S-methyltransferase [Listeria farberi]MBC2261806.1 methylated-DNA--[protein]-cysteine S-methyltransferase [Listeria farberi]MBC2268402.1 methylated-DNA--[protein]-cysteine S-methyltransferase [Listeria farberi]MBC2287162.1 methylated-DNA--[protein]-cysteine S-methyltransferase [Listeria 
MEKFYDDSIQIAGEKIYFAATDKGLFYVGKNEENLQSATHDPEKMRKYKAELLAYLNGESINFTSPIDLSGTALQLEVFEALKKIPYGETRTYTEIAAQINRPKAVRAVGTAIGKNPLLVVIPCHRVIGKTGKLTGYSGGIPMKQALLNLEKTNVNQFPF